MTFHDLFYIIAGFILIIGFFTIGIFNTLGLIFIVIPVFFLFCTSPYVTEFKTDMKKQKQEKK